jgi:hypothetical protein
LAGLKFLWWPIIKSSYRLKFLIPFKKNLSHWLKSTCPHGVVYAKPLVYNPAASSTVEDNKQGSSTLRWFVPTSAVSSTLILISSKFGQTNIKASHRQWSHKLTGTNP